MAAAAPAAAVTAEGGVAAVCGCLWWAIKKVFEGLKYLFFLLTSCVRAMPIAYVSLMLRVFNIGNACLLAAACVLSFIWATGYGPMLTATQTFLAIYMGLFAVLLFIFETRFACTEDLIRRNFGFMFTYMGRTIFLIFLSAVCFGMLDPNQTSLPQYSMCAGAGAGTLMNAFLNCIVICSHPGFSEMAAADDKNAAGTAGGDPAKMSDAQIKAYLAAHPELAKQALASSAAVPTQPPEAPASSGGVSEWGAVSAASSKPAAPAKGGFFGSVFGGGAGGGGGGGGGKSMTAPAEPAPAPYVPPSVPAGTDENPFGGSSAAVPAPAKASAAPPAPPGTAAEADNPFAQ